MEKIRSGLVELMVILGILGLCAVNGSANVTKNKALPTGERVYIESSGNKLSIDEHNQTGSGGLNIVGGHYTSWGRDLTANADKWLMLRGADGYYRFVSQIQGQFLSYGELNSEGWIAQISRPETDLEQGWNNSANKWNLIIEDYNSNRLSAYVESINNVATFESQVYFTGDNDYSGAASLSPYKSKLIDFQFIK